jgi:hypothetical protein
MNERIDHCLYLAGLTASGCWEDLDTYTQEGIKRFAELIVRECARVARATPCPYEEDEVRQRLGHTWDMASVEAGSEIVKYFGVK